jgi:hypothetical protein
MYAYLEKLLKKIKLPVVFFGVLKVNDENREDPNPDPLVRGMDPGSGSTPKCHGSATLV